MIFTKSLAEHYRKKFLNISNTDDLAKLLRTDKEQLYLSVAEPNYHKFKIPKKSGGYREVTAPQEFLATLHKRLNLFLQSVYCVKSPKPVHGFVRSYKKHVSRNYIPKDILSNASIHLKKNYVLNLDIEDFFSSISATRVRYIFSEYPFYFNEEISTCLALLCTYEKTLPTGSPTSPAISNFACTELDIRLSELAEKNNLNYTRYADDITFSSDKEISNLIMQNIREIVNECRFKVNEKKWRLQKKNEPQIVTGVKVNEQLNVERKYVRNLRAVFHDITKRGIKDASKKYFKGRKMKNSETEMLRSLTGKINFLGRVKGNKNSLFLMYQAKLSELEMRMKNNN
ncbi:MAG: reverse transcriptase family protein [Bacteroidota bacterium]|jgi:RNA-directed DNA polymerase